MKVFIRQIATGEFLGILQEWTRDEHCRVDFESSIDALTFCRDAKMENVEIVLQFGDGTPEMPLQVDKLLREEPAVEARTLLRRSAMQTMNHL